MNETKKELRKHYKNVRLSMVDKTAKDKSITKKLLSSELYKKAETVLIYVSSEIEVDTHLIIKDALSQGKTVATPLCNSDDCTMEFYIIEKTDDLHKGAYGIFEPNSYCRKVSYDDCSICIVPGLSFDKDGYRLGFGKGYYDRFLSVFPGKSIGLCYNECICEKAVRDKYDKSVSELITETEIYNIK